MTIRAVLFDLDGTLVDSNEAHVAAWQAVFADAGHDVPLADIRGQIGKGGDNLVPALLPDTDEREQERLSKAHGKRFKAQHLDHVQPFPGAPALLARVHASGRQVVLASSASRGELKHYVALLGAEDLVDAMTSIDDVKDSKPAPDIFAAALGKAGVAADEAVAVGDSPFDMQSANRAGMGAVGVRSGGFSDDALSEAGATALYTDVAALLAGFDGSPLAG